MRQKRSLEKSEMKKINILHITWSSHSAGMLVDIVYLQSKDSNLKFDVFFCKDGEGTHAKRLREQGIHCHSFNSSSKYGILSNIQLLLKLIKELKNKEYDVVHMQEILLPFVFIFLRLYFKKAIFIVHNHGEFSCIPEEKIKSIFLKFKKIIFVYLVNNMVDKLIVNSDFILQETLRFGVKSKKILLLLNAIDITPIKRFSEIGNDEKVLKRKELGLQRNDKIISVAARLVRWKRTDILIKAFAKMKCENKKLLIMGDGEEKEELIKKVKKMQLEGSVLFLGFRADCLEIMAISDAFVLLSKNEPFGLAALEAVLLKTPVFVMQDSGGLKEFITNENGFVCKDFEDLVGKLSGMLSGKFSPPTFISHDAYMKKFDMVGYVRNIRKVYSQFLDWHER